MAKKKDKQKPVNIISKENNLSVDTTNINLQSNTKNSFFENPKLIYGILALTILVFFIGIFNGFVNWDDELYISTNKIIKDFSIDGFKKMLTTFYGGNYHPLVAISNAIEYHFFGENAKVYHTVNIVIHLINVYLVYVFFKLFSKNTFIANVVAVLFAIHPMHVESVAWISERKDVLYACFYLLAMINYVKYKNSTQLKYFIITCLFFVLSCLGKSMAVTLPLVLICLDFYLDNKFTIKQIINKIPLFIISLGFGMLALKSQSAQGYIADYGAVYNLGMKFFFVCYNFYFYILKLFIPTGLATLHPFPIPSEGALPSIFYFSPVALIALAFLIWKGGKYKNLYIFGIAFFVVSISIVLQILTIGSAVVAERYTYLPYLGFFFIIAVLCFDIINGNNTSMKKYSKFITPLLIFVVCIFSVLSFLRVKVWEDGVTLWQDNVDKYPESAHYAYYGLGNALNNKKDYNNAMIAYNKAIEINPAFANYYLNRSGTLEGLHQTQLAIADLTKAISLNPKLELGYYNRGLYYTNLNRYDSALLDMNQLTTLNPNHVEGYFLRGLSKKNLGDFDGAIADYNKTLQLNPNYIDAVNNLANVFLGQKKYDQAIEYYNKAIKLNPDNNSYYMNKAVAYLEKGDKNNACEQFHIALQKGNKEAVNAVANLCK